MNGAQIAHLLKVIGKGSELTGINRLYRYGRYVGAGQILLAVIAALGTYQLGKWGYRKLMEYLQENDFIAISGEVE